jgi:hypothetical protein
MIRCGPADAGCWAHAAKYEIKCNIEVLMQRILMLVISSLFLSLQVKTSGGIVGRWEAINTTKGGLGSTLQFSPDGSFTFSFGPLFNGTYKLDGNTLIISTFQSPPQKATTAVYEINIERDIMFQKTEYGVHKWARLSPAAPGSPPIVGRWGMKSPIYEFRRDGTFHMSTSILSMEVRYGRYKLKGNHLSLNVSPPGRKELVPQASEIEIRGDTLILRISGRRDSVMHRISPASAESPAIVGRWRVIAIDGTDNTTITEYQPNGEWTSRMPLILRKGRYGINGDLLTTTFDDTEKKISKFRFERGILVLKSPPEMGPEDRFKRIE